MVVVTYLYELFPVSEWVRAYAVRVRQRGSQNGGQGQRKTGQEKACETHFLGWVTEFEVEDESISSCCRRKTWHLSGDICPKVDGCLLACRSRRTCSLTLLNWFEMKSAMNINALPIIPDTDACAILKPGRSACLIYLPTRVFSSPGPAHLRSRCLASHFCIVRADAHEVLWLALHTKNHA
jgi:hypothetical protein